MMLLPPAPRPWPRPDMLDVWSLATWGVRVPLLEFARVVNPDRRRACGESFLKFCHTYTPHVFYDPNVFHLEFAGELERLVFAKAPTLLLKALAAPRGVGKTTVVLLFMLWCVLYGHARFAAILCDTGPHAIERMGSVKSLVLNNDRLMEDFPEICGPIRDFGGDARAAAGATPDFPWSKDLIRLANGNYIAAFGMDSGVAGRLKDFGRPDLIMCDDCETVDSAKSKAESDRLRDRLFQEVMKLPGMNKSALLVWICTLKTKGCLSDELTDRQKNPEWRGSRYRGLPVEPKRSDAWAWYRDSLKPAGAAERPADMTDGAALSDEQVQAALEIPAKVFQVLTPEHRQALKFYAANKDAMDAGAELLDAKRLPLHRIMHERVILGETAWRCEVQQDPPEDTGTTRLNFEIEFLQTRCVGEAEGLVPAWAWWIFFTIDMGLHKCHWEASAWSHDLATSQLIAQGAQPTNVNDGERYKMTDDIERRRMLTEDGIRFALSQLAIRIALGFPRPNGELLHATLVGVDARGTTDGKAWQNIVFDHCFRSGPHWFPLRGDSFQAADMQRAQGRNWICEKNNNPYRCIEFNADHYKTKLWNALTMPAFDAAGVPTRGARIMHRQTPREYLRHHTAEVYSEVFTPDKPVEKSVRAGWNEKPARIPNHWWDTAVQQQVLADIAPFVVNASIQDQTPEPKTPKHDVTLPDWAKRERF